MKNTDYLNTLREQLLGYRKILIEAAEIARNQEVTNYPIFVFFKDDDLAIGVELIRREKQGGPWSVQISSLEEFTEKGLISAEKTDEFLNVFKQPEEQLCIFVISNAGAQFVFLPKIGPEV